MDASWQPDPTGRHQYRWWDGQQWTEHVSDGGQQSVDPLQPTAPAVPATAAPPTQPLAPPVAVPAAPVPPVQSVGTYPGAQPGEPVEGGPVSAPAKKGKGLLIGVGIAAAVVVIGAAAIVLLGGDDGGGGGSYGVSEDTLEDDTSFITRSYKLDKGDAIRIRVEPDRRLDTNPGILVDEDTARAIAEVLGEEFEDEFSDSSDPDDVMDDVFTDSDVFSDSDAVDEFEDMLVYQTFDVGVEGEPDADWVVAPTDGTYQLVITSYEGDGDVRIVTEKYDESLTIDDELFSDDGPLSDRFFTDDDFFSDEGEYDPD